MQEITYNNKKKSEWEVVIGLEVHAQISSSTKLFSCGFSEFGAEPNSSVNFFDAAMPGTLPVLNMSCVQKAIKAGLGLNGKVNLHSEFDRKHYFYPDLPHGYQITQYYHPIIKGGEVSIKDQQNLLKKISIHHIHIEQDAGKSVHDIMPEHTCIDLNRAGIPLMEIVTEPDIRSSFEACAFINKLKLILQYVGASNANMEKGELRCDANVSVRKMGSKQLGARCEIKNLNSTKSLMQAIEYEADRQIKKIESGEEIIMQTRLFDIKAQKTKAMRNKEDAADYRYFPDPDLLPLVLTKEYVDSIAKSLKELPDQKEERYQTELGLSQYDASVIVSNKDFAQYFDLVILEDNVKDPKLAARWLTTELFGALGKQEIAFNKNPITAQNFAELIFLIETEVISEKIAKDILPKMLQTKKPAKTIVKEEGLEQITDSNQIAKVVDQIIKENDTKLKEYLSGKEKLFGFFIGQVMKKTNGKANPKIVNQVLTDTIKKHR